MDRRLKRLELLDAATDAAWEIDHSRRRYVYRGPTMESTFSRDGRCRKVRWYSGRLRMPYPPPHFALPIDDITPSPSMEVDPTYSPGYSPRAPENPPASPENVPASPEPEPEPAAAAPVVETRAGDEAEAVLRLFDRLLERRLRSLLQEVVDQAFVTRGL